MELVELIKVATESGFTFLISIGVLVLGYKFIDRALKTTLDGFKNISETQIEIMKDIDVAKNEIVKINKTQEKIAEMILVQSENLKGSNSFLKEFYASNNQLIKNNTDAINQNREALNILVARLDILMIDNYKKGDKEK